MSFFDHLDQIEDHRKDINKEYNLGDMIFLTMAAVLAGADGWKAIKIFGDSKLEWLRQYREFKTGIPTRHSIGRIIRGLSNESLLASFARWINEQRDNTGKPHIAFDGKTLRGSGKRSGTDALHLMSAMVVGSGLVLTQQESLGKKNEIKTMQAMLQSLEVKGTLISADAMHTQTETARITRAEGADYVLQLKDNQKCLHDEVKAYFHKVGRDDATLYEAQCIKEVDGEHGRIVERQYRVLPVSDWIKDIHHWQDIQSVIEVTRIREGQTAEISHYISSLAADVQELSRTIRHHWAIENSQHWVLDVTFREDESQIYAEDGAKNLAVFRRALLNLIKAHPMKDSVAGKRQRAYWDDKFRADILFG